MRLIDADALRDSVLKWLPPDPCGQEEKEYPFETDICVSLLTEIEEQPTIEPEPEWIPCSEKLPYAEYGESPNVYCYCYDPDLGGKWTQLLYYDGGVWCLPTGETFEYKVLAWYPLPTKPYKGDKDETD